MTDEKKKIDLLLDKNAAEQLAKVDWDRLPDEMSARLARAEQGEASPAGRPIFLKIAAAVAAAAAVVFVAAVLRMHRPSDSQPTQGGSSAVKSVAHRGTALVEITRPSAESLVIVHIGPADRKAVKCDVEIIDGNSALEKDSGRSAWIIISKPRPVLADNGHGRDRVDLIHLF